MLSLAFASIAELTHQIGQDEDFPFVDQDDPEDLNDTPHAAVPGDFLRSHYLPHLFAMDAVPGEKDRQCQRQITESCRHGATEATAMNFIRCRDCLGSQVTCIACALKDHRLLPFHRIEQLVTKLTDQRDNPLAPTRLEFWEETTLQNIGGVLYLGHDGEPCGKPGPVYQITVMDVVGLHEVTVLTCGCGSGGMYWEQLFRMKLFPASSESPRTAFTFNLLEHGRMFNLVAKLSLSSYHTAITFLSNPLEPIESKVCFAPSSA